jgi:hypothetical protein
LAELIRGSGNRRPSSYYVFNKENSLSGNHAGVSHAEEVPQFTQPSVVVERGLRQAMFIMSECVA